MRRMQDFEYAGKKVLLRLDLNVPVSNEIVLDDTRINKVIPTIKFLLNQNAKIIIASHFGRPKGKFTKELSLEFMRLELEKRLGKQIGFMRDLSDVVQEDVVLLENLRFFPGEEKNDPVFARKLASLAEFYINDAFSCSHRAHSSIDAITQFLPSAAGLLLGKEIEELAYYLSSPARPLMAIIGGSKISTKLGLLRELSKKVDCLVIGGGMANSFLKALDYEVGLSLYEEKLIDEAKSILSQGHCQFILPQDVVVAERVASNVKNQVVSINNIPQNHMILDIGPKTIIEIETQLEKYRTVIFNGPLGVFEYFPFSIATVSIARTIAKLTKESKLISLVGGGDIVAAVGQAGLLDEFSHISTAGGAFLEWLEGKEMPGIRALR